MGLVVSLGGFKAFGSSLNLFLNVADFLRGLLWLLTVFACFGPTGWLRFMKYLMFYASVKYAECLRFLPGR